MGLSLAVKVISGIAATPFIGHAVDRLDRKKLMVASDLALAAAMLLLVVLPQSWMMTYIVVLMALLGVGSTLFDVSLNAATPVILGTQDTLRANSWLIGGATWWWRPRVCAPRAPTSSSRATTPSSSSTRSPIWSRPACS